METLESRIDPQSPQFQQNAAHNRALTGELRERLAQARSGGGELAQKRHSEQGKIFVRDRIDKLLDPGSPFLGSVPKAPAALGERDRCRRGVRPCGRTGRDLPPPGPEEPREHLAPHRLV